MIKVHCPRCNDEYTIEESMVGRKLQCANCNTKFLVYKDEQTGAIHSAELTQRPSVWIRCPHCWQRFDLNGINYISRHIDLLGDSVLGPEAQSRFLPLRFSPAGLAIDARGMECPEMACPHCHLKIVDTMIDRPTSFFSIVGSPASGKSYFLTAMIWQLRKLLPQYFEYNLTDIEPTFNSVLNGYEKTLFLSKQPEVPVALPKTELQGMGYSTQVLLDGAPVDLPTPFVFSLSPMPTHPRYAEKKGELERNIILYDNAGEHFEPGRESAGNLATAHLSHSDGVMFLYDPLQDMRFYEQCSALDPQVELLDSCNQVTLFNEMTSRIRQFTGLHKGEKYSQPLIVVIAKFDALMEHFPCKIENGSYLHYDEEKMEYSIDIQQITNISFLVRQRLLELAPDLVGAAEAFSETVYFIPTSSFGKGPEIIAQLSGNAKSKMLGIKPADINPLWVEVPFLLHLYLHGLLSGIVPECKDAEAIANYRMAEDLIVFTFPGSRQRIQLPKNYLGMCITNLEDGKTYKLPDAEGSFRKMGNKAAALEEQIDTAFWNQ